MMPKRWLPAADSTLLPLLLLVFTATEICRAHSNSFGSCVPSSCGDILEIRYPFRLKGDPSQCGDPSYELLCQKNRTIIYLSSREFFVQSINYSSLSIRVVDPGLEVVHNYTCTSLPNYYTGYEEIPTTTFDDFLVLNTPVVFINCVSPVNSSRFLETSICDETKKLNGIASTNSSSLQFLHSYVASGQDMVYQDLEESCSIEMVVWASSKGPIMMEDHTNKSSSLSSIKKGLAYGFELSWYRFFCGECVASHGYCSLQGNTVTCQLHCYYDAPIAELGLQCQIEHYGGIVSRYIRHALEAFIGLKFVCGITLLVVLIMYKWRRKHLSMDERIEEFLQAQSMLGPINYTHSEIRKMSNNFRDKLGEGGHGTVYKGKLRSGEFVAVKMMSRFMGSEEEFINEVATIGRIHHVNVVRLVGFCIQGPERALVYEFMPHGSLEKYAVSPREEEGDDIHLSYKKMIEISLGVARGIDYLHRGCNMQILHFDIKPHNILLDEDFNPKISDFGLARLYPTEQSIVSLTAARGTMGYMAPELFYKNIGGISYKADVYSFGMMLIEIAARRKTINPFEEHLSQVFFPSWIYDHLSQGKEIEMMDANEEEKKMTKKMIIVALWCIQMNPASRPSMNMVVGMLEGGDDEILQMPPRPFLAPRGIAEEHQST